MACIGTHLPQKHSKLSLRKKLNPILAFPDQKIHHLSLRTSLNTSSKPTAPLSWPIPRIWQMSIYWILVKVCEKPIARPPYLNILRILKGTLFSQKLLKENRRKKCMEQRYSLLPNFRRKEPRYYLLQRQISGAWDAWYVSCAITDLHEDMSDIWYFIARQWPYTLPSLRKQGYQQYISWRYAQTTNITTLPPPT